MYLMLVLVSKIATSAGFIELYEDSNNGSNKATLIGPASTGEQLTDTLVGKQLDTSHYTITGTGAIAGTFTGDITGDVTGNADTATKIASITNSDIVQLTSTQTLTNKTLTNPTINAAALSGTLSGTFTGDNT